jgi:putative endonuclease
MDPSRPRAPRRSAGTLASAARRAAIGHRAELLAVEYLEAEGLVVEARNVRCGRLELDVIAIERDVVAVIEVRARGPGSWERALDSIDARKRERVRRAGAQLWSRLYASRAELRCMRFDAIAVDVTSSPPRIEHVRGAF